MRWASAGSTARCRNATCDHSELPVASASPRHPCLRAPAPRAAPRSSPGAAPPPAAAGMPPHRLDFLVRVAAVGEQELDLLSVDARQPQQQVAAYAQGEGRLRLSEDLCRQGAGRAEEGRGVAWQPPECSRLCPSSSNAGGTTRAAAGRQPRRAATRPPHTPCRLPARGSPDPRCASCSRARTRRLPDVRRRDLPLVEALVHAVRRQPQPAQRAALGQQQL